MTINNLGRFLEYFPEIKPPIIISSEEVIIYSRENKPLDGQIVNDVFLPLHKDADDEFTEFIPCFKLNSEDAYEILVYYKADLLKNEYHLMVVSEKGEVIDTKAIAGTFLKEKELISYVASIDEDNLIQVVIGSDDGSRDYYDPLNSQTVAYEIAPDGKIILSNHPFQNAE